MEGAARLYLHGLFQCEWRNMEKMAETVPGSYYPRLHHTLSESARDRAGVPRQWNGRLGKTDNSQVGVFVAVACDGVSALVDSKL